MRKEFIKLVFNLQQFASNPVTTSDSEMSKDMQDYYNVELLKRALPNLVYGQFAKHTPLPQHEGQNPRWRKFKSYEPATTPLQEGVTPPGNHPKLETIEGHTEQYGDYTEITDRVSMETIDPVILELTKLHGEQGSNTLDIIVRNEVMTGTNVLFAPKSDGTKVTKRADLDGTCNVTPKVISIAKTILKRNNIRPINGSYVGIIHPDIEHDITTHPLFIDINRYGENVKKIHEGEIGKLFGVRFVTSSNAKIWNDSAATVGATPAGLAVYGCVFIGEDVYGDVQLSGGNMEMIVKPVGSGGTSDPLNQRGSVGWKVTGYDAEILAQLGIVRLECCSSEFSSIAEAN